MAKKKSRRVRYLVLPNGSTYAITGETGKYWICDNVQFRKIHNWQVVETKEPVETAPEAEKESEE